MDIGARYLGNGRCRFRVFSPGKNSIMVEFPGRRESRPLQKERHGYWSAEWTDISPGDRYLFRLDSQPARPDPASHYQPDGVHGPSQVWDHGAFRWTDSGWHGVALEDMVMYELHAGTFTPEGSLEAAAGKLDHLVELGVNAVEIMPVNQFPGKRGWGYDGVYPFAVQNSYGGPDSFKRLVDACHSRGLAVILDVIYNHLGPEGNYLSEYGPYFTDHYRTPWGRALNFDGPDSGPVRDYFIENALHWFREYHVDALRLDAVHQIYDTSAIPFLAELSERVRDFSFREGRERLLIAESDLNDTRILRDRATGGYGLHGQWLDDFHHCLDSMLHREKSDYRADYGESFQLVKAYREGYVYSGEYSPSRRKRFGRSSAERPGREFVVFIQNHDQVGNRLTGERLSLLSSFESVKLAAGAILLSPYIPLLFMGEEYGEVNPFLFFADYGDPALVKAVREGRKREFGFLDTHGDLPDPAAEASFAASRLDWGRKQEGRHRLLFEYYRALIRFRKGENALRRPDKDNLEVTGMDRLFFLRRWDRGKGGAPDSEVAFFLNFNPEDSAARLQAADGTWDLLLDSADVRWDGPGSAAPKTLGAREDVTLRPSSLAAYRKRQS